MIVYGTHTLKTLLKSEHFTRVDRLAVLNKSKQANELIQLAQKKKIRAEVFSDAKYFAHDFYKSGGGKADNHQNAFAIIKEYPYLELSRLLESAKDQQKSCILVLDNLTDPQNFGSILRSAAFFGVDAIIITDRRSAPVTSTVLKISSGGFLHVPICRVKNLSRALTQLKDSGYWLYGFSEHAKATADSIEFAKKQVLIIGNEESGIRKETEKAADELVKLKNNGPLESLNAAVACAVALSLCRSRS